MRALLISDLHLAEWSKYGIDDSGRPRKLNEYIQFFETILSVEDIDTAICLGDVFHEKRLSPSILTLAYTAFKLLSKRANVILIAGNHDIYEGFTTFQTFDFAKIIKEPTVETIDGYKMAFVPYIKDPVKLPEADIVLGHFAVCDLKCRARDSSIQTKDLTRYKRVILGHEHKYGVFSGSNYHITYVGASLANTFADLDVVPSYFIFENGNLQRTLLDLPKYIISTSDLEPEQAKGNYVRLYAKPGDSVSALREKYRDAVYLEVVPMLPRFQKSDIQKIVEVDLFSVCKQYAETVLTRPLEPNDELLNTLRRVLYEAEKTKS